MCMIKLIIYLVARLLRVNSSMFLISKEAFTKGFNVPLTRNANYFLHIFFSYKKCFYHREILHRYKFGDEKVMNRKKHDEEGQRTKAILVMQCLRFFEVIIDISLSFYAVLTDLWRKKAS